MTRKATDKPAKAKTPRKASKPKATKETAPAATVEAAPTAEPVKPKMGRPSKYDPAFCDVVIELGEQGKSHAQMARTLRVSKVTMLEWTKKHPDFLNALKEADSYSQAWWEDQGQLGMAMGRDFNATAFIFQVKNRFKDDYSDKIEVKHDATAAFAKIWQAVGTGKLEGATP